MSCLLITDNHLLFRAAPPADPVDTDVADTDLANRLARLTEQQPRVLAHGRLNKQIADACRSRRAR